MATKIKMVDTVEHMHNWLDSEGKVKTATMKFYDGETIDASDKRLADVGDVDRCLQRLVTLEKAEAAE
jgi:hypothetical protein